MKSLISFALLLMTRLSALASSDHPTKNSDSHEIGKDDSKLERFIENKIDSPHDFLIRKPVTANEISYIANILEPKECLNFLYLLYHSYNTRRRRNFDEILISKAASREFSHSNFRLCEQMLLTYWGNPRFRNGENREKVSLSLRAVNRHDLADWLMALPAAQVSGNKYKRSTSCNHKTRQSNPLTQSTTSLPATTSTTHPHTHCTTAVPWLYISLTMCATATILLCVHYLLRTLQKSTEYIHSNSRYPLEKFEKNE